MFLWLFDMTFFSAILFLLRWRSSFVPPFFHVITNIGTIIEIEIKHVSNIGSDVLMKKKKNRSSNTEHENDEHETRDKRKGEKEETNISQEGKKEKFQ